MTTQRISDYKAIIVIALISFVVVASCKRREPESPFKSELPDYNSTVTVISAEEISEPIIEENNGELEVTSIDMTSVSSSEPTPEQIQAALQKAGYYKGSVDGKIGPKSKEAIISFQKDNNLTADGKVGPKTWSKLKEHLESPSR
jgi:murein L,D-transpeptidase YcbB/YkuD